MFQNAVEMKKYVVLNISGDPEKAHTCVKRLLEFFPGSASEKSNFLDAQDCDGATPLFLAAAAQNIEACQLLMQAGSKLDIK